MIDTLKYADRLKAAGVDARQAEAMARALQEAYAERDLVTTGVLKQELAIARADLRQQLAENYAAVQQQLAETNAAMQQQLAETDAGVQQQFAETNAGVQQQFAAARADVQAQLAPFHTDIALLKWMVGAALAGHAVTLSLLGRMLLR